MAKSEPDKNGFRGIFINTAGSEGIRGAHCQLATAAASNGIMKMTKPLAKSLHEKSIRVVTISPGFFKTPLIEFLPMHVQKDITQNSMLSPHFPGDPDQFAYMAQTIILNPHINATTIDMSCGLDMSTNVF